jgi:hypothetical protein
MDPVSATSHVPVVCVITVPSQYHANMDKEATLPSRTWLLLCP